LTKKISIIYPASVVWRLKFTDIAMMEALFVTLGLMRESINNRDYCFGDNNRDRIGALVFYKTEVLIFHDKL